jgi:hypothetical protein
LIAGAVFAWAIAEDRGYETPCWIWQRAKLPRGYGVAKVGGQIRRAHCVAYEVSVGPIPDGLELDHLCRVTACINPTHLEAVSHEVNCLRGKAPSAFNAKKTHCKHGHEFTVENTIIERRPDGRERRRCRACARRHRNNNWAKNHPRNPLPPPGVDNRQIVTGQC